MSLSSEAPSRPILSRFPGFRINVPVSPSHGARPQWHVETGLPCYSDRIAQDSHLIPSFPHIEPYSPRLRALNLLFHYSCIEYHTFHSLAMGRKTKPPHSLNYGLRRLKKSARLSRFFTGTRILYCPMQLFYFSQKGSAHLQLPRSQPARSAVRPGSPVHRGPSRRRPLRSKLPDSLR